MMKLMTQMAWVEPDSLKQFDFSSYLTAKEIAEAEKQSHQKRRLQKKASRLLIKVLYLSGEEASEPMQLEERQLTGYSKRDFLRLEIGRSDKRGRYLALFEEGQELEYELSFSHGNALSIGGLSLQTGLGIDLEAPAVYRREFYEQNFTAYEREWVFENQRLDMDEDQLFTFLWTIKESFVKSGATDLQSAWYMPVFSISELPPFQDFFLATNHTFSISDGKALYHGNAQCYSIQSQILTTGFFRRSQNIPQAIFVA